MTHLLLHFPAPVSPPRDFDQANLSPLILSWRPPAIEDQNGNITGYTIRILDESTGEVYLIQVESTTYTNRTLKNFTNYRFQVAAMTSAGIGPYSTHIDITTPEAGRLHNA